MEGSFAPSAIEDSDGGRSGGGDLPTLCRWLDLPRLAVLDVSRLEDCRWPARPEPMDGLLLDRVRDEADLARWATNLEALWGIPVVGALGEAADLRAEIEQLAPVAQPSPLLRSRLGRELSRYGRPQRLLQIACGRTPPRNHPRPAHRRRRHSSPLVIAVAYDSVFNCYFPDTLEALESLGATVVDFSPLRDDRLPEGADLVYLGCGHPERYAAELSLNHCMKLALRNHLRGGGRIYSEGGGMAYLCQHLASPETGLAADGRHLSRRRLAVPLTARRPGRWK